MKKYAFIKRLVDKITRSETNCEFDYYNHKVVLQSGTSGFVSVTVCNTADRYSGTMLDFSFDYWTHELHFVCSESKRLTNKVVDAFRGLYHCGIKVSYDQQEYGDKDTTYEDEHADENKPPVKYLNK